MARRAHGAAVTAEGSDPARTAAALAARRQRTDAMLSRVADAIHRLHRERRPVSFAAVARRAQVSRTFLYENSAARSCVSDAVERAGGLSRLDNEPGRTDCHPWRERAHNAEDALKAAHAEIKQQRRTVADLLGRVRDLEIDDGRGGLGRLATENTELQQRVRELNAQNRLLEERLQAARSNARFLDRRIADLEAKLLQP